MMHGSGTISEDFAAQLPADISFLIQGTNLKELFETQLDMYRKQYVMYSPDPEAFDKGYEQFKSEMLKTTGLDFEDDVLSVLTGDFAIVSRYDPPEPGKPASLASFLYPGEQIAPEYDLGWIIEVEDPAQVQSTLTKFFEAALKLPESASTKVSKDDFNGIPVLVLTTRLISEETIPQDEFIIGANDKLFVAATRKLAEELLSGASGFTGGANFTDALEYSLPNPTSLWYIAPDGINLAGDYLAMIGVVSNRIFKRIVAELQMTPTAPPGTGIDEAQLAEERQIFTAGQQNARVIASLVHNMTFSTASGGDDGTVLFRAVLTLAE
jgi:hypothetical protein